MKAVANAQTTATVHLCIQFDNEEAQRNADALIRLAQELAKSSPNVVLVNGANRRLIGNHWFGDHARRAIDENLHRRSWKMAALAYLLNDFSTEAHTEGALRE